MSATKTRAEVPTLAELEVELEETLARLLERWRELRGDAELLERPRLRRRVQHGLLTAMDGLGHAIAELEARAA